MTEYPKPYNTNYTTPRVVAEGTISVEPTAQQTPIIEVLVRVLEKEQAELIELVSALELRLSGVLRKVEPEPLRPDGSSGGQSPLAANLNQRVADVSNLAHRIKDIIKRLEV